MKPGYVFFFLFVLNLTTTNAQVVDWVRQGNDLGNSRCYGIGSDGMGNLYAAGSAAPPTVIDTITLLGHGALDIFVAKFNRYGDVQWAITFGGTDDDEALDISTDLLGNSFVTGYFGFNAIIGTDTFASPYYLNFFVCKINSAGVIQWVNRFDNPGGASAGKSASVNDLGQHLAVTGFFRNNADLDSINISGNYEDVFTASLNPVDGSPLWIRTGGGAADDEGEGVKIDNQGNVACGGYYKQAAIFDNVTFSAGGDKDAFLVNYSSAGMILWARVGTGPGSDAGYRVTRDRSGNVYAEGHYSNGVNFDGNILTSNGGLDGYVNAYDPSGNLKWCIHGGSPGNALEFFSGFTFDNYGYLWCVGGFDGAAVFDTFHVTTQAADMVLCRIDTGGQLLNVLTYGSPGDDYGPGMAGLGFGVAYVPECFIAVAAGFTGTANFGNISVTSGGGDDACVIHVDVTCTIGIPEDQYAHELSIFPNPANERLKIRLPQLDVVDGFNISICNMLGEKIFNEVGHVQETEINVQSLPPALYLLEVTTSNRILRGKFLKE